MLNELAEQLDTGALYDRDLPELTGALNQVLEHSADACTSVIERAH